MKLNAIKHFIIVLISGVYLINPSAGIFELLPDNLPFIGNLDEGMATLILINSLKYFGYDLTKIFDLFNKKVK